jgi:hypothetical protein
MVRIIHSILGCFKKSCSKGKIPTSVPNRNTAAKLRNGQLAKYNDTVIFPQNKGQNMKRGLGILIRIASI